MLNFPLFLDSMHEDGRSCGGKWVAEGRKAGKVETSCSGPLGWCRARWVMGCLDGPTDKINLYLHKDQISNIIVFYTLRME